MRRRAGRRGDGYFPGGRLTAAERASQGTTRLVVSPGSAGLAEQREEISAFATRLGLA